jgi:hypothetical protein
MLSGGGQQLFQRAICRFAPRVKNLFQHGIAV